MPFAKRCLFALFVVFQACVRAGACTDGDTPIPQGNIPRAQAARYSTAAATAGTLPLVRLGYLVPSNRTAQADAAAKLQALVTDAQRWYRDQMDQQGYGPKTFRVETGADGVTPLVHIVTVTETDAYLRVDPWSRTIIAAQNAGLTPWTPGEVWFLVPETHVEAADGTVAGGSFSLGSSYGSGTDAGVAVMSSDQLAMCRADMADNDQPYDGQTVSEVGPYPLKGTVTFPWYSGSTFSAVCSSTRGAFTHELSHGFGLMHDFRNDINANGNLMGNGFRGIGGNFAPSRFPADFARLSTVAAGALNVSRYFNATSAASTTPPAVNVTTLGTVAPVGGLLPIAFTASDSAGLAWAWLYSTNFGGIVGEFALGNTSATAQFNIPFFTAGTADTYTVTVLDQWGNRQDTTTMITPASGAVQAPQPYVQITPPVPLPGEPVTLDASRSTDPVTPTAQLRCEWDTGSGNFASATGTALTFVPNASGNRLIRLRITNAANAKSVSTPMAIHVHQPAPTFGAVSGGTALTWLSKLGFLYQLQRSTNLRTWTNDGTSPFTGTGGTLSHNDSPAVAGFQHLQISRTQNW